MGNFLFKDRVKESTTTIGSGDITLGGTSSGFSTFLSAFGSGSSTTYCIAHETLAEWEVGRGTITSSPARLIRNTVLASSNANAAVNFSVGSKQVFSTVSAQSANSELRLTPELFGAVGNGVADDTAAVQACLDMASDIAVARDPIPVKYGFNWLPDVDVCFLQGNYTPTGSIYIDGVLVTSGTRVAMEDGIYSATTGSWIKTYSPTTYDAVRVRTGRVNTGRRMYWTLYSPTWQSWPMQGSTVKAYLPNSYRITSPIRIGAGVVFDGRGGEIVRDLSGSYSSSAVNFLNQSENEWCHVRSADGGSAIGVYHWSSGFYQPMGTLIAHQDNPAISPTGSTGVTVYRYSFSFDTIEAIGFDIGVDINGSDIIVGKHVKSLSAVNMGVRLSGGNIAARLHIDSTGAPRYPQAKLSVGVGLGLIVGATLYIDGTAAANNVKYFVSCLAPTEVPTPVRSEIDDSVQYISYLNDTETISNVVADIHPLELNPEAILRLSNIGSSHFNVHQPSRQFGYGKSWDTGTKKWDNDALIPDRIVEQDKVGRGVTVNIYKHPDGPPSTGSATAGWFSASFTIKGE